jgi:hypothetical protein
MNQMMTFSLSMPRPMLEELALNVHGVESLSGINMQGVLSMIENVISVGLEEHLGEGDDFTVVHRGGTSFTIQISRPAISDIALNVHGVDSLEGLDSASLSELMSDVISAGLDEMLGYSNGFSVAPV